MKKYLSTVFCLVLAVSVFLCGCKTQQDKRPEVSSFFNNLNADFVFESGSLCFKGKLVFDGKTLSASFSYPQTVKGLVVNISEDYTEIKFKTLSVKKEGTKAVNQSFLNYLFVTFKDASLNGEITHNGSLIIITGSVPAGNYEITADEEFNECRILIPEKNISLTLTKGQ